MYRSVSPERVTPPGLVRLATDLVILTSGEKSSVAKETMKGRYWSLVVWRRIAALVAPFARIPSAFTWVASKPSWFT